MVLIKFEFVFCFCYYLNMPNITIPQKEYEQLRQFSSAYLKIVEEIAKFERVYPYDYKYIDKLARQARSAYKKRRFIEAGSVDEALSKFKKR